MSRKGPLRILVAHSTYRSGALSGENRVVGEEVALLRAGGHEVETLTPSPTGMSRPTLALRSLASLGTARGLRERVRDAGFDVVHFHNLYPTLGPRALEGAASGGAAVVMTLHNYRLMCIAATFFRAGHVCEDCFGRSPWPGVVHGCYRDSRAESAVLGGATVVARRTGALAAVHRFLAVSGFVRDKHVEAGLPSDRVLVKPNVVPGVQVRAGAGTYFLVLSRLSVEKGLDELVQAWDPGLGILRIVGDGPLRSKIERLAEGRGIRVEPPVAPEAVPALLAGARALLLPSACYEGQPRAVLEAYAAGVPVIASRLGALPELVLDGESGMTVSRGDLAGWRAAVATLADADTSLRLGRGALALWRKRFSPQQGLAALEEAYSEALLARSESAADRAGK